MGRLFSSSQREIVMPIVRYIVWVGASLLTLLFVANWYLPEAPRETAAQDAIDKPIIRIASAQHPPESVFIDTDQTTIVPPPTTLGNAVPEARSPMQAYAWLDPPPVTAGVDRKKANDLRRQRAKVATLQVPSVRIHVVASGNQAATVPPTKLSFLDILSGAGKSLFNLR
jgi:hypothetical protein